MSDVQLLIKVIKEIERLKRELDEARARAERIESAGRAVVERWDTPAWKNAEPTASVIGRLRAALAGGCSDE